MAINRFRYYLGPVGLMQPTPPFPQGEPEAPMTIPVAEHISLSGRSTQDRLGRVRRTWPLVWGWLSEDDELHIQAALRGQAGGGIRLMDPRRRNLATEDVSTGGGQTLSAESFEASGPTGTLAFGSGGGPLDLLGITAGRQVWTGVASTETLYGVGEKTPLIQGSTYRVSAYIKSTAGFQFSARPFDLLNVEQATVVDPTVNPSTAGVWTRFSWEYTPLAGDCSVYFGLTATGAGDIETTGWMYQIDEPLKKWTFGYGCPEVLVAPEAEVSYWKTKYANIGIVLREV